MTADEIELPVPVTRRSWIGPASIVLLSLALAAVLATTIEAPLKDDVAWLLHVAQETLRGQRLYTDLIEVNPPLIVWIMTVPAVLGCLTGASPEILAVLIFGSVVLTCAAWSARILGG